MKQAMEKGWAKVKSVPWKSFLVWVRVQYRNYSNSIILNVWVSSIIAILLSTMPKNGFFPVLFAAVLIIINLTHSWLLKIVKDERLNEVNYWQQKSRRYSWLMSSIQKLIHRKTKRFRSGNVSDADFRRDSIWMNLQMLCEFYSHYDENDVPVNIRISFFVPSEDRTYLHVMFFWYADGQEPHFLGDHDKERDLFKIARESTACVVKAWLDNNTEVLENEKEITYFYSGQRQVIKSLLAYPVVGHNAADIVGVICLCADRSDFFRRDDVETHKEYISEFALRIALEMLRLESMQPKLPQPPPEGVRHV